MKIWKALRKGWRAYKRWEAQRTKQAVKSGGYFVYWYWDDYNGLLYVGQTSRHPLTRGMEHMRDAEWFDQATSLEWQEVSTREKMEDMERQLIRTGEPIYNKVRYTG